LTGFFLNKQKKLPPYLTDVQPQQTVPKNTAKHIIANVIQKASIQLFENILNITNHKIGVIRKSAQAFNVAVFIPSLQVRQRG